MSGPSLDSVAIQMPNRWLFRLLCLGGVVSAVVGFVLLLIALRREHRDLQRLYVITAGWLSLAFGAMQAMAAIAVERRARPRGPR